MKIDIEFNSGAQLPMDAIPELARLAEAHGFDCAWGGEANNKDPTVMLSAIAAVTRQLKVGSAIYHILGRTPATLAFRRAGLTNYRRAVSTGHRLVQSDHCQMAWPDSSIIRWAACRSISKLCGPRWPAKN